MDVAVFELGGERYAVDLAAVQKVIPIGPITPVPGVPAHLLGAMNVRGRVLPVLDLGALLCDAGNPCHPGQESLLLRASGHEVVGVVAQICDVSSIPDPTAEPGELVRQIQTAAGAMHLVDPKLLLLRVSEEVSEAAAALQVSPFGALAAREGGAQT